MNLDKYLKLIIKNYKIILYFVSGMVILALFIGIFIYKPAYKSISQILVKEVETVNFITPLGNRARLSAGINKNPILTQIQILKSNEVAAMAWEKIKDDPFLGEYPKDIIIKIMQQSLELKNPPGTDILEVSVNWNKPDEAQLINKGFIEAFIEHDIKINRKSISQTKNYIQNQLVKSEKKLKEIRNKIKEYRKSNNSVNIDKEALSVIDQITAAENQIAELEKQINAEKSKSDTLSDKLGVDVKHAINSIALGQNANLQSLQRDFQKAQQQFATLNVKYTALNPHIQSLTETIKEIRNQISDQIRFTIGENITAEEKNSIITDPVRTEMVNQLVLSQTNFHSAVAQKKSLENTLKELTAKLGKIPEKQETLQALLKNQQTLSAVVQTLNTKLIEAKIRESEIISKFNIIENPSLPETPNFPTIFQLIVIFGFVGILLGVGTILGIYYAADTCQGTDELEEILKAPVLGVIPWLTDKSYKTTDAKYHPASMISIIYQKIITAIKIKCSKKSINVIGISSAEFEKRRSVVSVNIAKNFAKAGHSVLIIDADFRDGCIAKEFNIAIEGKKDLTDVIIEISSELNKNSRNNYDNIINSAIIKVSVLDKLFIIPNNSNVKNPYEILSIEAFQELISYLKEKFDYIILDTPPLLAVSDSIMVSQYIDGLIVLCGIKTSRTNLAKIQKLCQENYVEVLGSIARDSTTEVDLPENQYIKHLSINVNEEA